MGNLLVSTIQLLEESLIVEMNIERNIAMQKFLCCGAAKPKMHGKRKKQLTIRHGCPTDHSDGAVFGRIDANSPIIGGIFVLKPFRLMEPRIALAGTSHSGRCPENGVFKRIF
jgi:hypothetical protein